MKPITVFKAFGVDAAPNDHDIQVAPGVRKLVLDVLDIQGAGTVQVTASDLYQSNKEIEIVSADENAIDSFTPGRVIRGRQSGKFGTVINQRSASNRHYLAFDDSGPSAFHKGEIVEERNLQSPDNAALATVDSGPVQQYIVGDMVADTSAVSVDTLTDIAVATKDAPRPFKSRKLRLSFTFAGSPTSVSFLVRVA